MSARSIVTLCIAAIAAILSSSAAHAQTYPVRPIRMIVASSAGSNPDIVARVVANGLGETLGQQIVIDNRAGAGGNIGAEIAVKAAPDGYTLFLAHTNHSINTSLYRKISYDLIGDFAPITLISLTPYAAAVNPSLPVKSCGELLALAKAQGGKLAYASAGTGSGTFFVTEYFASLGKVKMLHVPYKGGGPAIASVIAGETSVYFPPVAPGLPHFRGGKLRPLGVSTAQRLPELPEVPPVAETLPGFEMVGWAGLMAPLRTPKHIVQALHKATLAVLGRPEIRQRLSDQGYVVKTSGSDEMQAYIKGENDKYARLIRDLGLPRE